MKPVFFQRELGPMKNFVYLIGSDQSAEVLVVDPGWEASKISQFAEENDRTIVGVLCTHSHLDHVNAAENLLETHDVPVFMLDKEISFSNWSCSNLKAVSNEQKINVGGVEVQILHTPGHTVGSTCYRVGNYLVTGDTLFINGCGRCDMAGGDPNQMYGTLKRLSEALPESTVVLPGHDYGDTKTDTLENQKRKNPYLQHSDLASFFTHRMRPRQ